MNSVYFILGTPGSGRRALVRDLIENGLAAEDKALVLLADGEAAVPADADLAALPNAEVRRWQWTGILPPVEVPAGATVFFLADALTNQIDRKLGY